jgi:hypothetical protein
MLAVTVAADQEAGVWLAQEAVKNEIWLPVVDAFRTLATSPILGMSEFAVV